MRLALALSALILGTAPGVAQARQTAQPVSYNGPTNGAGLRYLSWSNKTATPPRRAAPAAPRPTAPDLAPASASPVFAAATTAPAIPLNRLGTPSGSHERRSLTPAEAFYAPQATGPAPEVSAGPIMTFPSTAAAPAATAPVAYAEVAPPPVVVAPPPPPPAPVPVPVPVPEPAAHDPMAPRRDAAIFRLAPQGSEASTPVQAPVQASVQASVQAPVQPSVQAQPPGQARYYSVHRQAGRRPDAIATPQPVYLDALPIEMTQLPGSSQDLANPEGPPALLRQANGTVRAMPQTTADDLP